jgi:hypothetical protein
VLDKNASRSSNSFLVNDDSMNMKNKKIENNENNKKNEFIFKVENEIDDELFEQKTFNDFYFSVVENISLNNSISDSTFLSKKKLSNKNDKSFDSFEKKLF